MEATAFAYAAGVTDAWRLMETSDETVHRAMLAVAVKVLQIKADAAKGR